MSSAPSILNPVIGIPDYLYKYVSVQRALEILLTQKVYFAHCSQFNDPFEGQFAHEHRLEDYSRIKLYEDETDRTKKEYENIQKHLNKIKLGFFSMSDKWDSYPMWAHYANQHKGCCIRFNFRHWCFNWEESFPFMFIEKVKYRNKHLGCNAAINHLPHKGGSVYMSKLESWGYEREWRAIMYDGDYKHYETKKSMLDERILKQAEFKKMHGNGMYSLGKKLLDGIILGRNMGSSEKEAVKVAADKYNIEIIKAKVE